MKSNANESMYRQPKVLMRRTGVSIISDIDDTDMFALKNLYLLIPKENTNVYAIQAIISSRLLKYYHFNKMGNDNKAFAQFQANYVENFPFVGKDSNKFQPLVEQMRKYSENINLVIVRFQNLISSEFNLEKWPTKLNKWWLLDFADFVSDLKLQLSLQQKDELLSLFEKYKAECAELDQKIQKTSAEIDNLVYKLYNLAPEEIALVEQG